MSIHQLDEQGLALFAKYVYKVEQNAQAIAKYVKEKQEQP